MMKKILLFILIIAFQTFGTSKEEIKSRIADALDLLPGSTVSAILVYNPLTRDTIYSLNSKMSVIPASNTKLFTTSVALSVMGSDYHLSTKIMTADKKHENGIINGNLYIKGFGNSMFTSEDLDKMVETIKKIGIKKVNGNIVGDDYFFDELYTRSDWINDEHANVHLPPISALVIDRNRILVKRRIRVRRGKRRYYRTVYYTRNISSPPLYAAELLKRKLVKNGIKVTGRPEKGHTPEDAVTLADSFVLLKDLIQAINKHSDNFLAECLFKTLGAVATGNQGNSFYSTQTIIKFLKDNGIYSVGTSLVDGSGISRFDQVTVSAIVGLLEKVYFDLAHFQDFYNSLSVAGKDGTLRHRMLGSAAENNFHGKTGTLNGVSSLSGYLITKQGVELIVSMIFQFKSGGTRLHRRVENKIVEILSDWQ